MITADSILKPRVTLAVLEQRAGRSLPATCRGTLAERTAKVVKAENRLLGDKPKKCEKAHISNEPLTTRISNLLRAAQPKSETGIPVSQSMPPALAAARLRAQHIYEAAALAAIAAVEAKKKSTKEQKRKDEAAILLLLLLAGEDAYRETHQILSEKDTSISDKKTAPTPAELDTKSEQFAEQRQSVLKDFSGRLADTYRETHTALGKADPTATVPTPKELDGQAEQFAEQRQTVLKDFSGRLADTIRQTRDEAADAGIDPVEVARELRRKVAKESEVMADTEAQVTLGSVQLDRLKRAGFASAIWATCEDERVRPSHVECGEQGPVQLGKPFSNGLLYPGDPAGPASELIGCRCWLVGASRQSHSLQATAHDVSGEKRDETGKWTAGDFHAKTNDELSKMNARDHWKLWKEHEDAPGEYKIWMFADEYEPGVKGKFRTFKSKESFQKWFDEWPVPVSGSGSTKRAHFLQVRPGARKLQFRQPSEAKNRRRCFSLLHPASYINGGWNWPEVVFWKRNSSWCW